MVYAKCSLDYPNCILFYATAFIICKAKSAVINKATPTAKIPLYRVCIFPIPLFKGWKRNFINPNSSIAQMIEFFKHI